jgi:hypothetical protein
MADWNPIPIILKYCAYRIELGTLSNSNYFYLNPGYMTTLFHKDYIFQAFEGSALSGICCFQASNQLIS